MLSAKRLAAVMVSAVLILGAMPAAAFAAAPAQAPDAIAATTQPIAADSAPGTGSDPTADGQAQADSTSVDPNAAVSEALSLPDPISHLRGKSASHGEIAAPLTLRHQTTATAVGQATSVNKPSTASAPKASTPASVASPNVTIAKHVTGTLTDVAGHPLAGIWVVTCITKNCPETPTATTGVDGTFSVWVVPASYMYFVDPTHAYAKVDRGEIDGNHSFGTIHMQSAIRISGTVRDTTASHAPIAGVTVVASTPVLRATSAADGTWTMYVPAGTYCFSLQDPRSIYVSGYLLNGQIDHTQASNYIISGATAGIDVQMPKYVRVKGHLTDKVSGAPVAYALIIASSTDATSASFGGDFRTTTDQDGTIDLGVYPAGNYQVYITGVSTGHGGLVYTSGGWVSPPATASAYTISGDITGLDLQLARRTALVGKITDEHGLGHADWSVNAYGAPGVTGYTALNPDGSFAINIDPGTFQIRLNGGDGYHSGWYGPGGAVVPSSATAATVTVASGWSSPIVASLPSYAHVTGKVVDHNGMGVGGIRVVTGNSSRAATTLSDGSYDLSVDPGTYTLQFTDSSLTFCDGWLGTSGFVFDSAQARSLVVSAAGLSGINITLPQYYTITGSIDYNGCNLTALAKTADGRVYTTYYASGSYQISVPPGSYYVGVQVACGGAWWYTPGLAVSNSHISTVVTVADASVSGININVPPVRTISGTVHFGSTPAAYGTPVVLYDLYLDSVYQGNVSSSGTFSFPWVRPGRYVVGTGSYNSYAGVWYGSGGSVISSNDATVITIGSANVSGINITMPLMHTISGVVTNPSGAKLPYVDVEAFAGGVYWDDAVTDAGGNYSILVPPGELHLWFGDLQSNYAGGWYIGNYGVSADWQAAKAVAVGSSNVAGLSVRLPNPRYIGGSFTCVNTESSTMEIDAYLNGSSAAFGIVNGSTYKIPVLPGTYTVRSLSGNCYVGGWYGPGGFAIDASAATPVAVASSNVGGINISVPANQTISGTVFNDDAGPMLAAVSIYHNGHLYKSVVAQGGVYTAAVPGASWTLGAWDAAGYYASGWYSTKGTVRSSSAASPVNSASNPSNINFTLAYLTPPVKPTSVAAQGFSTGAVVTWKAPANDGGSTITRYTVTAPGGKICVSTGALRCVIGGLVNGTSYQFRVTATNALGTGPASDPSAALIPTPLPGPPGDPTAVAYNAYATVSWPAPSVTGGSVISGYTVTSNPGAKTCHTTGALTCKVTGLAYGTPYSFTVTATNATGTGPASTPSAAVTSVHPGTFHPMAAVRVFDSRTGGAATKVKANSPRAIKVAGANGIPTNAFAVAANLTITNPTNGWAAYLGNDGSSAPTTSTLNFLAGRTVSNGATVALTQYGYLYVTYLSSAGSTTDAMVDISGYFTADATGDTYHPISPVRIVDSRPPSTYGKLVAGTPKALTVAGVKGVPAGVKAVTGNLTVVNSSAAGSIYAGPAGLASPTTATLNFGKAEVGSNNLTVALSTSGQVWFTFKSSAGATSDVVFDVTGFYTADATGVSFRPITPVRLLDTRFGNGITGKLTAGQSKHFLVATRGGIPAMSEGVNSVTGNVTIVDESFGWAVWVGPTDNNAPTTSNINFNVGDIKANGFTCQLGPSGTLSVTYLSNGANTTDLVIDITGYFVR